MNCEADNGHKRNLEPYLSDKNIELLWILKYIGSERD